MPYDPVRNANKKVIDTQCTCVLFSRVFATRKSQPSLVAPLPFRLSSHSTLFFSEVCALFSVTAVSQPFVYQSLRHSFHRDGGSHPSSKELCAVFAFCCSPLPVPKPRRINTYEISRKCCKQRTYGIANSFRCNTYEKQGGGGSHPSSQELSALFASCSSPLPMFQRSDFPTFRPFRRSDIPTFRRAYSRPLFSFAYKMPPPATSFLAHPYKCPGVWGVCS